MRRYTLSSFLSQIPLYPRGLQAGGQMELLAAGLSPGFEMSLSGIELLAAAFAGQRPEESDPA
jgi:hypothetical protein